jgi:glucose 1-dehydrogenase
MKRLDGKVALITGSARGIGRGVALCLAAEGADIVINDRVQTDEMQEAADAVKELGRQALMWPADVTNREAVAQMITGAVEQFGRLDIAVANAITSVREPVLRARWEGVRQTIEVAQFGVFHLCQMAAQQMVQQEPAQRSRGKIIIIGSVLEQIVIANNAAYNMSKAAINHFARSLALELAPYQINVNVINPGWIDTPGERKFYSEEDLQTAGRRIPWGRIGKPEDIGHAAVFLASDEADYITGTALKVDGGYVLGLTLPELEET